MSECGEDKVQQTRLYMWIELYTAPFYHILQTSETEFEWDAIASLT